ncbi:MAG TPA: hypothetical protein VGO40_12545 [Longimicrobium sp.]|nr:hypothetical protein [Longimicrobium sp.]
MPRKKKPTPDALTVSQARAQLFELIDAVTQNPEEPVVIEHRDREERAVLVDEGHYRYLVNVAHGVMVAREQPFKLFGSMRLNVPEAEFDAWLDDNRRTQADLAARKLGDL